MSLSWLNEGLIEQNAAEEVIDRGETYARQGAVETLSIRGETLEAEVRGSAWEPYRVVARPDARGRVIAGCSCPYAMGGWCKHIVAALLIALDKPETVTKRPAIADLLAPLDADTLREVLLALVTSHPELSDPLEALLALRHSQAKGASSPVALDPSLYRRQVRALFKRMSSWYGHDAAVYEGMRGLIDQAQTFLENRAAPAAIITLDAITGEFMDQIEVLAGEDLGDTYEVFTDLGQIWVEAMLSAELSPAERTEWEKKLTDWGETSEEFGVEDTFDAAATAARRGWDLPALHAAMKGESAAGYDDDEGADGEDDEDDWFADQVLEGALNVLERQGRYEEALNVARSTGETARAAALLLRLGRLPEASQIGLAGGLSAEEILHLARGLLEAGDLDGAFRIAEHGLSASGPKAGLASWLRDEALRAERTPLAVRAAVAALEARPGLADYRRLKSFAGESWPEAREQVLASLRRSHGTIGGTEILTSEGLYQEALNAAERSQNEEVLAHAADAVLAHCPDRVIQIALRTAESIIGSGQASAYSTAVDWLRRARDAMRMQGQEARWQETLAGVRDRYGRRWKLMALLKDI